MAPAHPHVTGVAVCPALLLIKPLSKVNIAQNWRLKPPRVSDACTQPYLAIYQSEMISSVTIPTFIVTAIFDTSHLESQLQGQGASPKGNMGSVIAVDWSKRKQGSGPKGHEVWGNTGGISLFHPERAEMSPEIEKADASLRGLFCDLIQLI